MASWSGLGARWGSLSLWRPQGLVPTSPLGPSFLSKKKKKKTNNNKKTQLNRSDIKKQKSQQMGGGGREGKELSQLSGFIIKNRLIKFETE